MAFTVTINAVDRSNRVAARSIQITKDGAMETAVLTLRTADGYRPAEGDAVRITQGVILDMGGEVARVRARRGNGGSGGKYVTDITVRGWFFEAQDVTVFASFPAQGLYVTVQALFSTYLSPKGWTNLSPATGGPSMPALKYTKQNLRAIFDDLTKRSGYPWRVNGDRQMAFVQPGSLVSGVTLNETNCLIGNDWERDRTRRATRLFVITGGSGTAVHQESHTANGTQSSFPVNVLPNEQAGSAAAAAAAAANSLSLRGLRASSTVKIGDTFTVGSQGTTYTVSSDATTTSGGDVTVAFTPGLTAAVEEGDAVVFDVGTFVRLQVNGVDTPINSGNWSFNETEARFVKTGGAPAAGTIVKYIAPITFPATVRAWHSTAQLSTGAWNYATIRDAEVQASDKTDLASTKEWADDELASRMSTPKKLKITTFEQGLYPWLRQPVLFSAIGVSGDYLINRVVISDVGLRSGLPRVELELLEGDAIGRDWTAWWRERQGSTSGGSVTAGVGGGGTGTGGGGGTASLPEGTTLHLGGSNSAPHLATTTFGSAPEAIPTKFGGTGMAGSWKLRVPLYQLAAGTVEARLYDQTTATVLATVSTTTAASDYNVANFAFPEATFTAPSGVDDVLLQVRVTSGSREVVVGHATLVKL